MEFKTELAVDQFQLKHALNPQLLLDLLQANRAQEMGLLIRKQFPFVKDEERSFQGELPTVSLNKDHQFFDLYRIKIHVYSEQTMRAVIEEFQAIKWPTTELRINKIIELLSK